MGWQRVEFFFGGGGRQGRGRRKWAWARWWIYVDGKMAALGCSTVEMFWRVLGTREYVGWADESVLLGRGSGSSRRLRQDRLCPQSHGLWLWLWLWLHNRLHRHKFTQLPLLNRVLAHPEEAQRRLSPQKRHRQAGRAKVSTHALGLWAEGNGQWAVSTSAVSLPTSTLPHFHEGTITPYCARLETARLPPESGTHEDRLFLAQPASSPAPPQSPPSRGAGMPWRSLEEAPPLQGPESQKQAQHIGNQGSINIWIASKIAREPMQGLWGWSVTISGGR